MKIDLQRFQALQEHAGMDAIQSRTRRVRERDPDVLPAGLTPRMATRELHFLSACACALLRHASGTGGQIGVCHHTKTLLV